MKNFIVSLAILASINFAFSQSNLVRNGSFELNPNCAFNLDSIPMWKVFYGTPYLFSATCGNAGFGVPGNVWGSEVPQDGNSYIGSVFADEFLFARTAFGQRLDAPLQIGTTYIVQYWLSHADTSRLCTQMINMTFGVNDFPDMTLLPANNFRHLGPVNIITQKNGWVLFEQDFVPDSAYQYFTFSNDFTDPNTPTSICNSGQSQTASIYYIDNISIIDPNGTSLSNTFQTRGKSRSPKLSDCFTIAGKPCPCNQPGLIIEHWEGKGKHEYRKVFNQ